MIRGKKNNRKQISAKSGLSFRKQISAKSGLSAKIPTETYEQNYSHTVNNCSSKEDQEHHRMRSNFGSPQKIYHRMRS